MNARSNHLFLVIGIKVVGKDNGGESIVGEVPPALTDGDITDKRPPITRGANIANKEPLATTNGDTGDKKPPIIGDG